MKGPRTLFIVVLQAASATLPVYAVELTDSQAIEARKDSSANTAIKLSSTEQTRARLWEVEPSEWKRYRNLMQGIRGSVSPDTISPIEVLGIHARDDSERRHYAERWARIMYEDATRILAFQHAYDEAIKRLYPGEPLIDVARLPEKKPKSHGLRPSDRVLFFTRPDCPPCDALLRQVLDGLDGIGGVDIYLQDLNTGDDKAVRNWASRQGIDAEHVRKRRITLNHDAGALAHLTGGKGETPYLLRLRDDKVSPIRGADL